MTGRLKKARPPDRDRIDDARLKSIGAPAHINPAEDRLLARLMPEAHGEVVRRGLLAEAGRRGDDRLTRLVPAEAALLRSRGGAGTRNPASGLLEFWGGDDPGDSSSGKNDTSASPDSSNSNDHGGPAGPGGTNGADRSFGWDGSYYSGPVTTESLMSTPSGYRAEGYEGIGMTQYSPPDTWGRVLDVMRYGPPPSYAALGAVPGRYGMPNARGPGIVGTVAGMFGGPMMSGAMRLGSLFDAAMSPATRAASLAENAAIGARNSTGRDTELGSRTDAMGSPAAGYRSSELDPRGGLLGDGTAQSAAARALDATEGISPPTVQPGAVLDAGGRRRDTLTGLPQPVQNLLADYIWRGRQGKGFPW